ncbi:hypothetical protein COB55_05545 [Candidatus Wolfebacteria bacterium]|nr:MAG: hypothetical protein COB55_05545 [Candidatus Wolfebacteria bacterium]
MTRKQYKDFREDLIDKLIDKDWFKIEEPLISPYTLEKDKTRVVINRICGESVYNKYDSKEWGKLDKYFIEIIDDILKKYDITEIGFLGDLVDGSYEHGDIEYYVRNEYNNRWCVTWSPGKWKIWNGLHGVTSFFNTELTKKQVNKINNKLKSIGVPIIK